MPWERDRLVSSGFPSWSKTGQAHAHLGLTSEKRTNHGEGVMAIVI
jgi:hypothetical protein